MMRTKWFEEGKRLAAKVHASVHAWAPLDSEGQALALDAGEIIKILAEKRFPHRRYARAAIGRSVDFVVSLLTGTRVVPWPSHDVDRLCSDGAAAGAELDMVFALMAKEKSLIFRPKEEITND